MGQHRQGPWLPYGLVTYLLRFPNLKTGQDWPALPCQSAFSLASRVPGLYFYSSPHALGTRCKSIMLNLDLPPGPSHQCGPGSTSH